MFLSCIQVTSEQTLLTFYDFMLEWEWKLKERVDTMQLTIDKKAQAWFEEEMGVSKERGVRFLGKVYGCSPIHEGFSLAVEVDAPSNPYVSVEENGITYFVETGDEWFFQGHNLEVSFDEKLKEPSYNYTKIAD